MDYFLYSADALLLERLPFVAAPAYPKWGTYSKPPRLMLSHSSPREPPCQTFLTARKTLLNRLQIISSQFGPSFHDDIAFPASTKRGERDKHTFFWIVTLTVSFC